MLRSSVYVLFVLICVGYSECGVLEPSEALPVTHHHRHHGRRHQMQDQMDALSIRQDTHHILLQSLQEALGDLQEPQTITKDSVNTLRNLQQELHQLRESLAKDYHAKDDVATLRREMAELRSHCGYGVSSSTNDEVSKNGLAPSDMAGGPSRREHATIKWLTETVTHLQETVTDLQQDHHHLQDQDHQQQEVLLRVSALSRDVQAVRSEASSGVARAEVALEDTRELRQDLLRLHNQQADHSLNMAQIQTKMETLNEGLAEVFDVLPEGTMLLRSAHNKVAAAAAEDDGALGDDVTDLRETQKTPDAIDNTFEAIQQQKNVQKELENVPVDADAHEIKNKNSMDGPHKCKFNKITLKQEADKIENNLFKKIAEKEHQAKLQLEETRVGLAEVRSSSVQLMASLEALESRVDRGLREVRSEVAKLEFTVGKTEASQSYNMERSKDHIIDDSLALKSQIHTHQQHIDQLVLKVAQMQTKSVEEHAYEAICKANFTSLDVRIAKLEGQKHRKTRQNSKFLGKNWPSLPIN